MMDACGTISDSLNIDSFGVCNALPAGSTRWFQWLIFFVWLTFGGFSFVAFLADFGAKQRILLIVDDLDRCGPQEIVELIESLKLLLEEGEVQRRVQVLMLIDEDVLSHAVALKFGDLIKEKARNMNLEDVRATIIREHMEKLFICHLRLPEITSEEISSLTTSYASISKEGLPLDPAGGGVLSTGPNER
jgi:hypothetical protein